MMLLVRWRCGLQTRDAFSNEHKKAVERVTAAAVPRYRPRRGEQCWLRDGGGRKKTVAGEEGRCANGSERTGGLAACKNQQGNHDLYSPAGSPPAAAWITQQDGTATRPRRRDPAMRLFSTYQTLRAPQSQAGTPAFFSFSFSLSSLFSIPYDPRARGSSAIAATAPSPQR
jgi:hypothetical protein